MYTNFKRFRALAAILVMLPIIGCQVQSGPARAVSQPGLSDYVKKRAFLTFDDGPSDNTERILQVLRHYRIHATFFVIGTTSAEGRRLYRRIHEDGHVIGNHTYSHNYPTIYSSVQAFAKDTERLERLLEKTIGVRPTLLRYPGGSNNLVSQHYGSKRIMPRIIQEMNREGYKYMDWNVSSTDAARPVQPKHEIVDAVLSACKTRKEAIILFHDVNIKTTTVEALPTIIESLQKQGFQFDVLSPYSFHFQF